MLLVRLFLQWLYSMSRISRVPGQRLDQSTVSVTKARLISTCFRSGWWSILLLMLLLDSQLLLLLDGHSTHYQSDVVRFASDHNIIVLCLPPHYSRRAAMRFWCVFQPLKAQWTNVCYDYFQGWAGLKGEPPHVQNPATMFAGIRALATLQKRAEI